MAAEPSEVQKTQIVIMIASIWLPNTDARIKAQTKSLLYPKLPIPCFFPPPFLSHSSHLPLRYPLTFR